MVKHMSNKGFTIIESIWVIMIICILMSLTMTIKIPKRNHMSTLLHMTQFLHQTQMEAMVSKQPTLVECQKNRIIVKKDDKTNQLNLSENVWMEPYKFSFNAWGHIKKAKTIKVHIENNIYKIVYQVGSGYFYVQ